MTSKIYRLLHLTRYLFWIIFRPNTQGVRVIIIHNKKVLLIKHSYRPELYIPGGGVKKNETYIKAAAREIQEEVGITVSYDKLQFMGVFESKEEMKNDVVVVFINKLEKKPKIKIDKKEIIHAAFYPLNALPDNLSNATRRRINEYKEKRYPLIAKW